MPYQMPVYPNPDSRGARKVVHVGHRPLLAGCRAERHAEQTRRAGNGCPLMAQSSQSNRRAAIYTD